MYTCHLIKLYYKLYRNKLPTYFENGIQEYGKSQHDLRHSNIRLPAIRCEYGKINAKYQIVFHLRSTVHTNTTPAVITHSCVLQKPPFCNNNGYKFELKNVEQIGTSVSFWRKKEMLKL